MVSWVRARLPKPTPVFDAFWYLAGERQRLFRLRLGGALSQTDDPILQVFKFTNAYRASDRTSQYLIRNVIYDKPRPWRDTFTRVLLFKLFNRIETWNMLEAYAGEISAKAFHEESFSEVLDQTLASGGRIYSAAYIMPSAVQFGAERKHLNHLRLLAHLLKTGADESVAKATSLRDVFDFLLGTPSFGPFLAYQFATDLNYSPELCFPEDHFVMPGPGAQDGIAKCFVDPGDLSLPDIVRWTMETQEEQFERRGIRFDDLWGRPLQLIDCQNLFCEVSKYARAAHPEYPGRAGRTRIKQRFHPRPDPITAWYPPKWGLNDRVSKWMKGAASSRLTAPSGTGAT